MFAPGIVNLPGTTFDESRNEKTVNTIVQGKNIKSIGNWSSRNYKIGAESPPALVG